MTTTSSVTVLADVMRPAVDSGGGTGAVTTILVALIAAGLLTYIKDAVKAFRARKYRTTPEGRDSARVEAANGSLLVVVKARDELEADNARLRAEIAERDARYAEDRTQWRGEKAEMRSEIDTLSAKLRALLQEVEDLKVRHA